MLFEFSRLIQDRTVAALCVLTFSNLVQFDSKIIIYLQAGGAQETQLQSGRGAAEGEDGPDEAGAEGDVATLSSGLQDVAAVRQLGQVRSEGNIVSH